MATREITELLIDWRQGDERALAELMPLVYRRLKKIAGTLLRGERPAHTLDTTALVHEAYLRLANLERLEWKDRAHFYGMSARVMRRVLVDYARGRNRAKRGGDLERLSFDELRDAPAQPAPDVLRVDEGLGELAKIDSMQARIVELRFFGGLDREEIAEVLKISSATVTRRWRTARAWLLRYLSSHDGVAHGS